jgi:zinc transport system substrate-binding protein
LLTVSSGCSTEDNAGITKNPANSKNGQNKVTIVTSFYPIYIFTLNIVQDIPNIEVINITKPLTGCLHDYALTPEDMKNLEKADILVINGAGMESFLDKVISQMPDLKIIDSSKGIALIPGEGEEGDNPHVWVSISHAITQVANIGEQLSLLDPDNAEGYKQNSENYLKKLEVQRAKMKRELEGISKRNIVTFHEAFPYFAEEFNLNIVGVIEREPGAEPSAKELAETIEKVKALRVKALFVEPQYPDQVAEIIAKETGSKVYTLDPGVTGPLEAGAYIEIMDNNLQVLKEALK